MKIFIMTDLEGVAGVQDSTRWCLSDGPYYMQARELLTLEINAAIEGFLAAGATGFLVADGHGYGAVNPDQLHSRAELSRNWNDATRGSFSLEADTFEFAAWIGQHPMAGAVLGHLCHTGNMGVIEQRINDIEVGEFGDVAMVASELGVRTIFATGCQAFCEEAAALVPGIETVAVKRGTQPDPGNHLPAKVYREHNTAAIHLQPEEARKRIRAGAERAVKRAHKEDFGLIPLPDPPYTKTRIIRGDDMHPPRILRQSHPSSLLELQRSPHTIHELRINPAAPGLREELGKPILFPR